MEKEREDKRRKILPEGGSGRGSERGRKSRAISERTDESRGAP